MAVARTLRGQRYVKTPKHEELGRFLTNELPFLDYEDAAKWYKKAQQLDMDSRALIGCNDRFFLLVGVLGRRDARHPWLFDRAREVEARPDGHIDLWSRFHYKAVVLNELVPTPQGWRRHGDLGPGDQVFGPDGTPCNVIARTPVFTNAYCYRVAFDKGYSVVVSGDHLWTVDVHSDARINGNKRERRRRVTVSTSELMALFGHGRRRRHVLPSVQLCQPLQYPVAALPIHPYAFGVWLGDGSKGSTRVTVGLNDADELQRALEATGIAVKRAVHSNAVSLRLGAGRRGDRMSSEFANALRDLGVYNDKHVPDLYLQASIEQRRALLRGLMDTDGHCDTRGTATFVNINEQLSRGVFALAASLGLKPSLRKHTGTVKGAPYPFWQVSFQAHGGAERVFGSTRKQARATKGIATRSSRHAIVNVEGTVSEPCSCIQVDRPDGLYLIGEHCVPTHNSTIITFAGAIQEVLCDPEIKIAIFSVAKPIAWAFLSQIKEEFENNDHLKYVYPDVLYANPRGRGPDGRPSKWSVARGITVKRKSNPKEATIEAHGLIDGQPTSRHYDLHIYDDMVTQDYLSEDSIRKTTERWELADNLGSHIGVRKWMAGTRYHFADTYGVVMDRGSLKPRIYPATDDGTLEGTPVFLSQKRWDEIKRDQRSTVSAQCLLNPAATKDATFSPLWLKAFDVVPAVLNVYILVDPSKGSGQRSDRTAIAVIGIDQGGNKYLLDGVRHRMKLSDRWDLVKHFKAQWERHPGVQMVKVGWERYGKDVEVEVIEDMQLRENNFFEIEELNTPRQGGHSKADRIERLEPDIRNGRFYLPCVVFHPDFVKPRDELQTDIERDQNGYCYWSVWSEKEARAAEAQGLKHDYHPGQIIYRPMLGLTKRQRFCDQTMQRHRIVRALKRRDEDSDVYDLTRAFIGEMVQHPFAPHDDLIDAVSRIYDIDPQLPVMYEAQSTEPVGLEGESLGEGA